MEQFKKFYRDESAATAVEYGLIVALISASIIGSLNNFSAELLAMWEDIGDAIDY